jgi:hypothetical protein
MVKKIGNWYHYSGAIHIHTTESDGALPLKEVVQIGRRAGLDFMIFCDHMGLGNREAGMEGFYGDTLVVIGYEHNDPDDRNHLMIFGSPAVYPRDMKAGEYVSAARNDGALSIIAHPIEHRSRFGKYPPYPWTEWQADQVDGLELWNQMSEWLDKLRPYNKILMAFSPRKSMVGPTEEVLRIWDRMSRKGKCVGIAGVDAHAFPVDVGPFKVEIFPYKVHFRSLRTHLLLDRPMSRDLTSARQQLYEALRNCRVFFSNMRWGTADSFDFRAEQGGEIAICGDSLTSHEGVTISIGLPSKATIKLIRDGKQAVRTVSDRLHYAVTQPGLYRAEAWKGKRGWIFSNHIRIGI